jgi:Right handed beta helix region
MTVLNINSVGAYCFTRTYSRNSVLCRYFGWLLLSLVGVSSTQAASVSVAEGGDLQAALNQAQGGDTITLAAGAAFTGHYQLAHNGSSRWITIQSSAIGSLPAGQRVSKTQANFLPKLITPDAGAVLVIPSGANYYRFVGVEFTEKPGVYVQDLIQAGTASEKTVAALPHDLDFDRVYVHALLPTGGKRGLALNSGEATVENSYFENFVSDWQDTQAIAGWNGPGPYRIQNNFLQAGGEIVAFGGATTSIRGVIPSDILIENNDFFKPTSWWDGDPHHSGPHIRAKNHFELKNAQRVLVQNNTFTNNMVGADQVGCTILLAVRDEGGQVPWATVSHITVQNNVFRHVAGGIFLMGHDGDGGGTAQDLTIRNNLFVDLGVMGGDGRWLEIVSGVQKAAIDHNTAFPTGWLVVFAGSPSHQVNLTNNIVTAGAGIAGDGGNRGEVSMRTFDPDGSFDHNLVIQPDPSHYAGAHFHHNQFAPSIAAVGFTNPAAGNYRLAANSPYRGPAEGTDFGAVGGFTSNANAPAPVRRRAAGR